MSNNKNNTSTAGQGFDPATVDQEKIRAAQEAAKAEMNGSHKSETSQQEAPQGNSNEEDSFALAKASFAQGAAGLVQAQQEEAAMVGELIGQMTTRTLVQAVVESQAKGFEQLTAENGVLSGKREALRSMVVGFMPNSQINSPQTTLLTESQTTW